MQRIRDENINSESFWNRVYAEEHLTDKKRLDDERLGLLNRFIRKYQSEEGQLPKFVDVGCGFGEAMRWLHHEIPGLEMDGVDISKKAIQLANEDKEKLRYHHGTAYKLPFDDDSRDIVWIGETIEHLEEPQRAIEEAVRVLRDGGLLLISVPFKRRNDCEEHVFEFSLEDFICIAREYGQLEYVDVVCGGLAQFGVFRILKDK